MFPNLVTYHIYQEEPLPHNDALAYQYILAGNGRLLEQHRQCRNTLFVCPGKPASMQSSAASTANPKCCSASAATATGTRFR